MSLDFISPTWTLDDLLAHLEEASGIGGLRRIGEGKFAVVYESPHDRLRALKVVQNNADPCFEAYVSEVWDERNPHLPRIHDIAVLADGVAVYELDRLEPIDESEIWDWIQGMEDKIAVYYLLGFDEISQGWLVSDRYAGDFFSGVFAEVEEWMEVRLEEDEEGLDYREILEEWLDECASPLCEAALIVARFYDEMEYCGLDLHAGNIMRAPSGDLVITDPMASVSYETALAM